MTIDVENALPDISAEWLRIFQNFEFNNFLLRTQNILVLHTPSDKKTAAAPEAVQEQEVLSERLRGGEFPTLSTILHESSISSAPMVSSICKAPVKVTTIKGANSLQGRTNHQVRELREVLRPFLNSDNVVQKEYGRDPDESLKAFECYSRLQPPESQKTVSPVQLQVEIAASDRSIKTHLEAI